jgi:hypothetical protein
MFSGTFKMLAVRHPMRVAGKVIGQVVDMITLELIEGDRWRVAYCEGLAEVQSRVWPGQILDWSGGTAPDLGQVVTLSDMDVRLVS